MVRSPSSRGSGQGSSRRALESGVARYMQTRLPLFKKKSTAQAGLSVNRLVHSLSQQTIGSSARPIDVDQDRSRSDSQPRDSAARRNDRRGSYKVGDVVIVKLKDGKTGTVGHRTAIIRRIFSEQSPSGRLYDYAHVHWMVRSPLGRPNEWFLEAERCQHVPCGAIVRRLPCAYRGPKAERTTGQTSGGDDDGPFWQFVYSKSPMCMRDPTTAKRCDSCHTKDLQRRQTHASPLPIDLTSDSSFPEQRSGLSFRGIELHPLDFVYLDPQRKGMAWEVAQILKIASVVYETPAKDVRVRVRIWERVIKDEPRIVMTTETRNITLDQVVAKCWIAPSIGDCDEPGDLVLEDPSSARLCSQCTRPVQPRRSIPKLPCMDLYSGGGGTVLGAHDYFEHVMAVDFDKNAAETLRHNFPSLDVRHASVHDLHHADLRRLPGEPRNLPKRGSVFLLTACPPCQGHSGANAHKTNADFKNNELFITMSVLRTLQPEIFLFENVTGFLGQREDGTFGQEGGGVASGSFAQTALELLTASGYQWRIAVLDCRSYGSPQSRQRVFIIAARSGITLPEFPEPTHANPDIRSTTIPIVENGLVVRCPKYYVGRGTPGTGPYPAVTVRETISDLPPFEYRIPGLPESSISTFSAGRQNRPISEVKIGFEDPVKYASGPRNQFQKAMRGANRRVVDHYTPPRTETELKLIRKAFTYANGIEGNAQCVDPNRAFATLMTASGPGGKASRPIHYNQRRTLTIAERKRAQGVPDTYRLHGSAVDQDLMLGNMVNVQIGRAMYRAIRDQVVVPEWNRRGRPGDFAASWRYHKSGSMAKPSG